MIHFGARLAGVLLLAGSVATPQGKPMPETRWEDVVREIRSGGYRVRLDLSRQVLRVSVPSPPPVYGDKAGTVEETIHPMLRDVPDALSGFVPAALLIQKAKQFDDGLYAAVDLAAEKGAGSFAGKAALLGGLLRALGSQGDAREARVLLLTACRLGGVAAVVPPDLAPAVDTKVKSFLADEKKSKPLGFYTWSRDLESIFRQDRFLQQKLEPAEAAALVDALRSDGSFRGAYEGYLSLASRLTNPLSKLDLRELLASPPAAARGVERAFFPASVSHETGLIQRLYRDRPIPEGFSLVDEMLRQIRAGTLKLAPRKDSGWYDYQTWAHEALVIPEKMPEAQHLTFDEGYKKELLDLFKGAQALARETHVKQLELPETGAAPPRGGPRKQPTVIPIAPDLTVEPLATLYQRRAEGYRFVRGVIEGTFGPQGLKQMQRQTPEGPAPGDLDGQLAEIEALFRGAYATASGQIGLPNADAAATRNAERFATWSAALATDADLGRDARMMVPVFYDLQRRKLKVWVFLGWAARRSWVEFATQPAAQVFDAAGQPVAVGGDVVLAFHGEAHTLVAPVTAEVYVSRLLNRDEFRAVCGRHRTRSAILAALQ